MEGDFYAYEFEVYKKVFKENKETFVYLEMSPL